MYWVCVDSFRVYPGTNSFSIFERFSRFFLKSKSGFWSWDSLLNKICWFEIHEYKQQMTIVSEEETLEKTIYFLMLGRLPIISRISLERLRLNKSKPSWAITSVVVMFALIRLCSSRKYTWLVYPEFFPFIVFCLLIDWLIGWMNDRFKIANHWYLNISLKVTEEDAVAAIMLYEDSLKWKYGNVLTFRCEIEWNLNWQSKAVICSLHGRREVVLVLS